MRLLRTLLAILLLLVVVCAIALIVLIYMIDPNRLKPIIAEEVREKTGYEMVIDGKLSWSFYPRLAVKVEKLTLAEPKTTNPFMQLQGIKIGMELSDLLHRRENIPGTIYIDRLNFKNVHAEKVWANLSWQKNGFILQPIKSELYGGTMAGVIEGNELSTMPHLRWDLQFNNIQLKPLLQDIRSSESKLSIDGLAEIKFQGTSSGKTKQQILNQLNGNLQFGVNQGRVLGVDFNYYVQTADALLNRQKIEGLEEAKETVFDQLTGTAVIKDGIARTNDLSLVSKAFMAKGEGSLILSSQHVDASFIIAPTQTQTETQTQTDKIHWKIPLLITGEIKSPMIRLNMGEIQKLILKQEVEKIKDKAREQIKKHVPGKTGEFLQNLLGQ